MTEIRKEDKAILDWCDSLASVVVDAMVDAGLVQMENFNEAVAVASEEINVRLILDDYPPQSKKSS